MRRNDFFILSVLLTISGCATVNVPNMGESGYSVEEDEARMFKRAQEAIEIIDGSDYVNADSRLDQYLTGILARLVPDELETDQIKPSVRVLREPTYNAFALPNGRIYVHIGILAAAENEAQLASLLGHEVTHVFHRHALKQFRSAINKAAFFSTISATAAGAGFGGVGGLVSQLGLFGSLSGYSQNLEYEADETGFQFLLDQNYDAREAPKFFESLKAFSEDEKVKAPFFFSTHPGTEARIKNFNKLILEKKFEGGPQYVVQTDEFNNLIDSVLLDQIRLCLPEGYFKTAFKTVNRYIERNPDDKQGYYFLGEIWRQRQDVEKKKKQRDKTGDYPQAMEAFDNALKLDAGYADAIKGKARALHAMGEKKEAAKLFQQYLTAHPQAEDRGYIENVIKTAEHVQ